ncbi:hypothetical protein BCD_1654 (plasmid) [Borrelia crocidurae DOU]|uniref:Uncharacterized protein n=1 Tax=Borrelia crocidurae DOU TaxID=1293575 RepID=W5SLG6_9SPIR|nr:hypothetical protein BCD_1654 [Borrelia crocidurae DOU]
MFLLILNRKAIKKREIKKQGGEKNEDREKSRGENKSNNIDAGDDDGM